MKVLDKEFLKNLYCDELIVNPLRNRSRCYARQCIVKEIDRNTAAKFINEYHLQGYT